MSLNIKNLLNMFLIFYKISLKYAIIMMLSKFLNVLLIKFLHIINVLMNLNNIILYL